MPRTIRYHAYKESPGHGSYGQKYCLVCGLTSEEGNHQPPTDQMATAEAANPSPVREPVEYDDEPDECPECRSTTFTRQEDYTDYHGCRLPLGPIWQCTECKWAIRAL